MSSCEISSANADALVALLHELQQQNYRFITTTPSTHALINQRPGNELAHQLRDVLGWSRPFTRATLSRDSNSDTWFDLLQQAQALKEDSATDQNLTTEQRETVQLETSHVTSHAQNQRWRSLWRVSSLGELLLLHSAFPTLAADAIFFGPDTYRFAHAVNHYLDVKQPQVSTALDIGTGSGAAAIMLAKRYPQAAVTGVDINPSSLSIAAINGRANGADNLHWQQSNLLQAVTGNFDLIVANPPYLVDEAERTYRHGGGLLGAELSLNIVAAALPRLEVGGVLLLYTGVAIVDGVDIFWQALQELLASQVQACSVDYAEIDPDIFAEELQRPAYAHADRLAAVLLSVRRL